MFTLSGGHLFVLYDGAVQTDLRLVDTRHEQTATFAAEGWAKVTRRLGCAALTAGPGVTNGVSAMTAARMNGFADGRRRRTGAAAAVGRGSLQELDHVPIVAPVTKPAATATSPASIVAELDAACVAARTPHRGPTFVDIPLDAFGPASVEISGGHASSHSAAPTRIPTTSQAVAALVASPSGRCCSPVATCTGRQRRRRARAFRGGGANVPVFVNGMGRGTIPADHDARVLARPVDRVARSRPRHRRGDAARFPARFRSLRRRASRAPLRHAGRDRAARGSRRVDRRRPARDVHRARRTRPARPVAPRRWVARLRDEEQAKRAAEAGWLSRRAVADPADADLRRAARAGSTATPS